MTASSETTLPAANPPVLPVESRRPRLSALTRVLLAMALLLALVAVAGAVLVWRQVHDLQKQTARQMADMGLQSRDSGAVARLAGEQSREASARVALLDARVAQLDAQRAQVENVLQSLSRARDDNLLVEVDNVVQMGVQQAQLTGSVQPLLAALVSSERRLKSASQSGLVALQQAITQDVEQLRKTSVSDVAMLATRVDNVLRQVDALPLQSDMVPLPAAAGQTPAVSRPPVDAPWWRRWGASVSEAALGLVRVRSVASRDAALLPPEQGFLVRENMKLRLLNARMALLARQPDLSRSDVQEVQIQLKTYFQADSPLVVLAQQRLQEVQQNIHSAELPPIAATQAALAAAHGAASPSGK